MNRPEGLPGPAARYRHDHPPVRNVAEEVRDRRSVGQRLADQVTAVVGGWPFILVQSVLLALWMFLNVYLAILGHVRPGALRAWDPYPFILLNLVLSFQAAYTGPVVMMSQNRQSQRDRLMAQSDFEVNQKAEEEIQVIMNHLAHQDHLILETTRQVEALRRERDDATLAARAEDVLRRLEANERRLQGLLARLGAGPPAEESDPSR